MVKQILSIRLSRSFSTRSRQGICLDYDAYTQDAVILFARDSRTCSRADLVFLPRTPVTSSTRVKRPLPRNMNGMTPEQAFNKGLEKRPDEPQGREVNEAA